MGELGGLSGCKSRSMCPSNTARSLAPNPRHTITILCLVQNPISFNATAFSFHLLPHASSTSASHAPILHPKGPQSKPHQRLQLGIASNVLMNSSGSAFVGGQSMPLQSTSSLKILIMKRALSN